MLLFIEIYAVERPTVQLQKKNLGRTHSENCMARTGSPGPGIVRRPLVMGYAMDEVFQGVYAV